MNFELSEEMGSSFEAINYGIRPNKAVERRLIFETLAKVGAQIRFSDYRYIGFGALLFVDFTHAHLGLGINDLISIEYQENAPRASRNRPFGCIKVVPGHATDVLASGQLNLGEKPVVIWLDYDGAADEHTLRDIQNVCSNVPYGSFFLLTVNAVRASYLKEESEGSLSKLPLAESMKAEFGDFFPDEPGSNFNSMNGFPKVVARMLLEHCERVTNKTRIPDCKFTTLFNYVYKDGNSPMITVGGMIGGEEHAKILAATLSPTDMPPTLPKQFALELPVLTPRERLALDQLLPAINSLTVAEIQKAVGFDMSAKLAESYRRLYRHYPTYSQVYGSS
jgi:hypothetical protein